MPPPARYPESLSLWQETLQGIRPPPSVKTAWAPGAVPYVAAIVEPRAHPDLAPVLYNMAHVYGGRPDWGLCIFHGMANETTMRALTTDAGWTGVHFVNLNTANLTLPEYNRLLTSTAFWDTLATWCQSHALVFQTDTLLRRPIDADFFRYSYVGAPWPWSPSRRRPGVHVGNGGLSLRHVATMRALCARDGPVKDTDGTGDSGHEDVFFAERLADVAPSIDTAARFSVEHIPHPDPCGLHQAYLFHGPDLVRGWLRRVPGTVGV